MSTVVAPVAESTRSTKSPSSPAEATMSRVPPIWPAIRPPKLRAKTQYPSFLSSGERAFQLTAMFANVPCTSTTGRGCAGPGRQDQSLAAGGEPPGFATATAAATAEL